MSKVLYCAYPWAFDCPGGGERQLIAWSSHLNQLGITVNPFNQWEPNFESYDIFHFFSVMPGSIQLCEYAKSKGLKLLVSPNLWVTEDTKMLYPHDEIDKLLRIADAVIVNSILEADQFSMVYRLPTEKIHVAYNGYESSFLDTVSAELFYERYPSIEGKTFLLNVANIEPRKNQLMLLRGAQELTNVYIVNVGFVRDERYALECRNVGKDKFIELGSLPYDSDILRSALSAAAGFVMPSMIETPSIAALEAAAYGKRLLITRIGSTTEYFGSAAIYVDPMSTHSIAKGLDEIFSCNRDHTLVSEFARKFSWTASAISLKATYANILDGVSQ